MMQLLQDVQTMMNDEFKLHPHVFLLKAPKLPRVWELLLLDT